jgi:hypothetical protein
MRKLFSGRKRYALALFVVGGSLAVMGAQCQPTKPTPPPTGLSIEPTSHDFGTDAGTPQTFTVKNNGPNISGIVDIAKDGDDLNQFDVAAPGSENTCSGNTLAAGATCEVDVTFNGDGSPGPAQADLVASSDNPDDGEAVANLIAEVV